MSVIIRLQNLPWSANALDIRQYFRGLSIPEGGVHIVGGEQGDAFIAFSTDEDARQGMMMDGGKIKEVKLKLLLSSRTEMQKVIEQARQQSVTLHSFMQMPAPPIVPLPSLPTMPNLPGILGQQPIPSAMPVAIPSSITSTQPTQMSPISTVPDLPPATTVSERHEPERDQKDTDASVNNKDKKDRKDRSRSRDRDSDRRNKKDRDRGSGRRDRDRDRDRSRRRRERSVSRDRDRNNRRRDRKERSRSRDRSRSKDRDTKRNSRDRRRDSSSLPKDEKQSNEEITGMGHFQKEHKLPLLANPVMSHPKSDPSIPAKTPTPTRPTPWDGPRGPAPLIGNTQPLFKPLPGGPQGIRPMHMPFDVNHTHLDAKQSRLDVNLSRRDVNQPRMDASQSRMNINQPRMNVNPPHMNMNQPHMGSNQPHMDLNQPHIDINQPRMDVHQPIIDVEQSRMDIHPPRMEVHPSRMDGHPSRMDGHPSRMDGHPSRMDGHLSRMDLHPPRMDLHPSRMDVGHPHDMDGRRPLGGPSFSGEARPPISTLPHSLEPLQNPFLKKDGFMGREINRDGISTRGRESWPPSRHGLDANRFPRPERGFPSHPQETPFGNELDDYDRQLDYDNNTSRNFRGNSRGMGDFRRGSFPHRDRLVHGPGSNMPDRGMSGPNPNDLDRRGGLNSFSSIDRRGPFRGDRNEINSFQRDRFDPFDRSQTNDRQYPGRPNAPAGDRFSRDRHPNDKRPFDSRNVMPAMCVEIRNMPTDVAYADVRRFFNGLYISNTGLKLINDNHGNRVGIAYVRFGRPDHKDIALNYNGKPLRGSAVEVLHLSDEIFDKAIDSYRPIHDSDEEDEEEDQKKSSQEQEPFVCITVHDLPPYAKEADLHKLFKDIKIEEVLMIMSNEKKEYMAFVRFNTSEDAKTAMKSNLKPTIGHKAVKLNPCTIEQFNETKETKIQPEKNKVEIKSETFSAPDDKTIIKAQSDPRQNREAPLEPIKPETVKSPSAISDCILLKGLPVSANDRDILDFFTDVGLVPLRIHIMLDKFSQPTGDAFCEFGCSEEASRATTKNNMPLGKENISVETIPRPEMHEALGMPLPPLPIVPRMPGPIGNRNMPVSRPIGLLGLSPGPMANRMPILGQHQQPLPPQDVPIEGFGKPGCVLALENVPFRADIEEILDFFSGFELARENVIRRFNDQGFPTGDARVALESPSEAQRAIRDLRYSKMRGRPIHEGGERGLKAGEPSITFYPKWSSGEVRAVCSGKRKAVQQSKGAVTVT
uniref:(California timema) hypothetical protein n=1 Tax=Timema californicum TaxID=61474 RepID=A0A7R9IXG0_TIMCA|nr:unnamed protein product [Timema californicum]